MNDNIIWTKTILSVYRYLERISGAIDKIILQSALNSRNVSTFNYFQTNTYAISNRIIDLSDRKITLINLKILIENTLKEIKKSDAELLIQKYFDNWKIKEICQYHNLSTRTSFRKIENAVKTFSCRLSLKGYNADSIAQMLKNEGWILNVYSRFIKKNIEDFYLSNIFLAKAISM